ATRLRRGPRFPVAAISQDFIKTTLRVHAEKPVQFKVRAVVTVRNKIREDFRETMLKHLDAISDSIGTRNVVLELISTDINPKTKSPKKSNKAALKDWSKKSSVKAERVNYTAEFIVDSDFGVPGAIAVTNKHQREFFLESIVIEGFVIGAVHFPCNSWAYLPGDTPAGLRVLREKELINLRGDGKGVRKLCDRIYDFDTYNDLGNPDEGIELTRPTLGGTQNHPYPRRCRTGRAPTDTEDKFAWLRDDEFARQAIAGVNPVNIERLEVFPPVSKLDPEMYGHQESALKEEHILAQLNGMTVQQAIQANKLFMINYHDVYVPFVDRINALDGRKSYATRTIFFLTPLGTLKPIAIELSLGPSSGSKRVVTPPVDATTYWKWQLAKAHVTHTCLHGTIYIVCS
ncbi:hypothetical protein V8G54_008768, partial [Vigna mungo]